MFQRLITTRRIAACAALAGLALLPAAPALASPTLIVQNGILTGATGVDVNGTLYDVSFVDGTCASVYGACDVAHFDFTTSADAQAAAQALLDQVYVDGPAGNFDSHPDLIAGCGDPTSGLCVALTAWGLDANPGNVDTWATYDSDKEIYDSARAFIAPFATDSSGNDLLVWALWTTEATGSVPEPGSLALAAAALALMATATRRRT